MRVERVAEHKVNLDNGPLSIIAVSDLHIGSALFDRDGFVQAARAAAQNKNNIGIIVGDVMECVFPGDKRFSSHSVTNLDTEWLIDQVQEACDVLRETGVNWVLITQGNHESAVQGRFGVSPTRLIAETLGCTAGGYSGVFDIILEKHGAVRRMRIVYNHGRWRGAVTLGIPGASRFFTRWEGWDVALCGDSHHAYAIPIARMDVVKAKGKTFLVERKCYIVNCGAWSRMYTNDARESTFAERTGCVPSPRVLPVITVDITRQRVRLDDNTQVRVSDLDYNVML